jgi:hypothetical protein
LWQHRDPYDPEELLRVEQGAGWNQAETLRVWNPPWALPLALLPALLPFGLAALAWLVLQVLSILLSGLLLWTFFARGDGRAWIGVLLAAGFAPALFTVQLGQVSAWLLIGIVGFLYAQRSGRDGLAGASLALLMIKPHVTFLFLVAALWWSLRYRRPRVLVGWILTLAAASGIAIALSPSLVEGYLATAPPMDWAAPAVGAWLRLAVGLQHSWVQFLPMALGSVGLVAWLLVRRAPWQWEHTTGPLLLTSVVAAAYGWTFDQVVLLPAVVDLVGRLRSTPRARQVSALVALGLCEVALILQHLVQPNMFYDVWHPLALAGLYWWGVAGQPRPTYDRPTAKVAQ